MNPPDTGQNQPPEFLPLRIRRSDAPYLVNLLADNARPWNAKLREELTNFTTPTDCHNAKLKLLGRAPEDE